MPVYDILWAAGAEVPLSKWAGACSGCHPSPFDNAWHDSWDGNRPCTGIDIAARAGATTYVSGTNPSLRDDVQIWMLRQGRCIAYAVACDGNPQDFVSTPPQPGDPVLRWGHMDFESKNDRGLNDGVWKRIASVSPLADFSYTLSCVGDYPGPKDPCGWLTTGVHLHMDAPTWAFRNCSLYAGDVVSPESPVWDFGPEAESAAGLVAVRFTGDRSMNVVLKSGSEYQFTPEERERAVRPMDVHELAQRGSFMVRHTNLTDPFDDLDDLSDTARPYESCG